MGLDQYLRVRHYVGAVDYANTGTTPNAQEITDALKLNDILSIAGLDGWTVPLDQRAWSAGIFIDLPGIQWRKQYAVQDWFQEKLGEMENCKKYSIRREWLEELRDICAKILLTVVEDGDELVKIDASYASSVLPASSSLDYDGWYVYGLKQTKEGLDKILGDPQLTPADTEYEYHGWW